MATHSVGSIWSVLGIEDGLIVVLAGPFAASRGAPEYLVAPTYTGAELGFVWTAEDVRLETHETGLETLCYAAIWNARPVLAVDLLFQTGQLTDEATVAVRDAYWASLNERPLGKHAKLGRPVCSASDPAAQFQARELKRWQRISGRAIATSRALTASATFLVGRPWSFTLSDLAVLGHDIETSETLVAPLDLAAVGPTWVSFTTSVYSYKTGVFCGEEPQLSAAGKGLLPLGVSLSPGTVTSMKVTFGPADGEHTGMVETDDDLADAA